MGLEKSRQAYDKLIEALTAKNLNDLKELLNGISGQEMNASVLDDDGRRSDRL